MLFKQLLKKAENRKIILISLVVALLLLAVEAIRWSVSYVATEGFKLDVSSGYFYGFIVAVLLIIYLIFVFSK